MKRSQFFQEQIVSTLHQAERGEQTIDALCKKHSISEVTFYGWQIYGGMSVSETHRLKELGKENARLKRLLAEHDPAQDVLQEYLQKSSRRDRASGLARPLATTRTIASGTYDYTG